MSVVGLFVLGVIASVLLNLLVVVVLTQKGKSLNYMDVIMISLSISDLFQAGIGYSVEIYSYYVDQTITDVRCKIAGFSTTFLGLVSISHLVGVSIERYIILKFPLRARSWSDRPLVSLYVVIPGWVYGLAWATLPLLGWSSYARERGDHHRCGIAIANRDTNHLTYSYNLMTWCYLIPVIIIAFCCYWCYHALREMGKQAKVLGVDEKIIDVRRATKRKQSIMSLVLIATFLLAWTPYSVCVFVVTANGNVPHDLTSFASVFAKSSTLYNPIIYSMFMKDFRQRTKRFLGCGTSSTSSVRFRSQTNGGQVSITSVSKTSISRASVSQRVDGQTIEEEEEKSNP